MRCLSALSADLLCRHILVVNNGNAPETLAQLADFAAHQPKLTVLDGHGNVGFGRGCNLGAAQASEDLLVFVNPDCVVDSETLIALSQTFTQNPDALVGGALRNEDGSEQRGARRGELTLWSAMVSFAGLGRAGEAAGRWRDFNRTREAFPAHTVDMPVVSGALMAIGKSNFTQVGGFDPDFFLHVEDVDLCQRTREAGARVLFNPHATALHIGATSQVSSWAVERAKMAGFARYFWKNAHGLLEQLAVIMTMPLIIVAVTARWVMMLGQPSR